MHVWSARVEIIEMSSVILRDDEIENPFKNCFYTSLMYPFQCQSNEIGDSERDSVNEETDRRKSPRARAFTNWRHAITRLSSQN